MGGNIINLLVVVLPMLNIGYVEAPFGAFLLAKRKFPLTSGSKFGPRVWIVEIFCETRLAKS